MLSSESHRPTGAGRAARPRSGRPCPGGIRAVPGILLLAALVSSAGAEVIERILAVVDGRPVTSSEARLLARVRGEDLKTAVELLIDERLMFREASRLSQAAVTREDEERALTDLRSKLGSAEPEPEEELRRLARRELTILKYVEFRFRPQVRVDDETVRREYAARHGEMAEAPLPPAAEALRAELLDRALTAKIEAWIKDLRSEAEIRYNGPPP